MIGLDDPGHPYLEEVNEGVTRVFERKTKKGRLLDVGCGAGALGEALGQMGWEVWGIEQHPDAVQRAEKRLAKVVPADLQDIENIGETLGGQSFDALVFSDVLEHLADPVGVLRRYLSFLEDDGEVVVSVPNAVVWTNRFSILFGRLQYAETGVMDKTHLRFFTFKSARQVMEEAGLTVVEQAHTPHIVRAFLPIIKWLFSLKKGDDTKASDARAITDSSTFKAYMKYVYPFEHAFSRLWPSMFAFRILVVAAKRQGER